MSSRPGAGTNPFWAEEASGGVDHSLLQQQQQQQQQYQYPQGFASGGNPPFRGGVPPPRQARGPRRPYQAGSFLSQNRYASSATTITAVSTSSVASGEESVILSGGGGGGTTVASHSPLLPPHPHGLYSRPSAASSTGTLNASSPVTPTAAHPDVSSKLFSDKQSNDSQCGGISPGRRHRDTLESSRTGESGLSAGFALGPSHAQYLNLDPEEDDWLHDVKSEWKGHKKSFVGVDQRACCFRGVRGCVNVCSLLLLFLGVLFLFMGYPVLVALLKMKHSNKDGHGLGGTNATGQIPDFGPVKSGLIDPDTPMDVRHKKSYDGSRAMNLVFSDEFNREGRSFYPGDDPFWAAETLDYWETGDYEWYDPEAITTKDGALVITMSEHVSHNKNFRSGLLSSWNKFCFTGGRLEVAAVLPGKHSVSGFWPAVWTMGNLGRAGYGATTQGTWPYSYDSCDIGALPNQTYPPEQGGGPLTAISGGEKNGPLSYLPGQKLSRCTCPGEDHPGPVMSDGTFRGRGAPEIDVFEVSAGRTFGASQSLQSAPYNAEYHWPTENGAAYFVPGKARKNKYEGGHWQEAISGVSDFSGDAFEDDGGVYNVFGMEYRPGKGDDAYIAWFTDGELSWSAHAPVLAADPVSEISARTFPEEPMYVIMNFGMSSSFSWPEWDRMTFPAHLKIDWIRIYQPEGEENVGCDPPGWPTKKYIDKHIEAYSIWNLTTWTEPRGQRGGYGATFPKNRLLHKC